ncbi:MAG: PQQ-binding-like beta-propeller repeat protein [Kiritimatiellaeota bacterium]|nr:PQQ-binding-like beta-propeller repeat protein [Kiritimatiellota bacterium]
MRTPVFPRSRPGIGLLCLLCLGTAAADWPAYKADSRRSSRSPDRLVFPLALEWSYRPAHPPAPAWPEPGRELNRTDFDRAFQPVVAGGRVFFGSSADDTLRAIDAESGAPLWRFTAEGPIRFAPAVAGEWVYLAADDGWVYCLGAQTGSLRWRFRAGPEPDRILGNGRLVARSPCRTGVLVEGDVLYTTAGMWPAEGVYIYALNADTGRELWCNDSSGMLYVDLPHAVANGFGGVAPQGYLVLADEVLLVPTGRSVPAGFDRRTGRLLHYKPEKTHYHRAQYGGGVWCTAGEDIYFNPKNRFENPSAPRIGEADPCPQDGMVAYDPATGEQINQIPGRYRVLVANDVVLAAGNGRLEAIDLTALRSGRRVRPADTRWQVPFPERIYCMALAGGTLLTGNRGSIRAFAAVSGKSVWSVQLKGEAVRGLAVAGGRIFAATAAGRILCFGPADDGGGRREPRRVRETALPWTVAAAQADRAAEIVRRTEKSDGYALVIGEPNSALAAALARQTRLHVVSQLYTSEQAAGDRTRLLDAGLLGDRVAVFADADRARLRLPSFFANLVVVSAAATPAATPAECYRVLHPCGGALSLIGFDAPARRAFIERAGIPASEVRDNGRLVVRGPLPGAGEWRYPWADGGRSGVGRESRVRLPLELLWFGGPGGGRLIDRHLMGPPPVSANGRVFLEGRNCIIAFDAYTGRELWGRELENIGRKYAQYYSSNLVVDDDSVYVVQGDRCRRLRQSDGTTAAAYRIPPRVVAGTPPPNVPDYTDVEWPTVWRVLGPFPKGPPPLRGKVLAAVPDAVTVNGRRYPAREMQAGPGGLLDFTLLFGGFGLKPDPKRTPAARPRRGRRYSFQDVGRICYAFARIRVPHAGKALIGCGADWGMRWFIDGRLVFDALRDNWEARRRGYFDPRPCSATDRFFDADLAAGEHVLAVMVTAGSRGWAVTSASVADKAKTLMPVVRGENPNVPDLGALIWGYLSVTDRLLLGSYNVPIAAGEPAESQLLKRSESKAVFALDKRDGSPRWVYRTQPDRVVANIEIAWGDGRLFLIDGTSKADLVRARRRGGKVPAQLALIALDLDTGAELWRQDDVPLLGDRSMLSRLKSNVTHLFMGLPNWGHLVYARGTVLYGANAAYDAATGRKLWQTRVRPGKLPIVYGDRIITGSQALELRSGKPVLSEDPLTGLTGPWRYPRAYGCGPTAGCRNLLFFRAGDDGLFDMRTGGLTNFGGVRSGCARTLLAANGLLIHSQGYSGCPCSYSYKTNLALVSAPQDRDNWYVFPRATSEGRVRRIAVNFGAPGDRKDARGRAWLGFPRPMLASACPVPAVLDMPGATCYYRRRATASVRDTDVPWLYSSGIEGRGRITLRLDLRPGPTLQVRAGSPTLDARLDDPCWTDVPPIPFQNSPFTMIGAALDFRIFRDDKKLYFGYRRRAVFDHDRGDAAENAGADDRIEVFLMDRTRRVGIHFVAEASGKTHATFGTVGVSRKTDPQWKGAWRCLVSRGNDGAWVAEAAIPLETLTRSGLNPGRLAINCMSRNRTGSGLETVFLTDPYYGSKFRCCSRFLPFVRPPRPPRGAGQKRSYTIRMHFAETAHAGPGGRTFDVRLQGRTVLEAFDPQRAAGGPNAAAVRTFADIRARDRIEIELTPTAGNVGPDPILCALELEEAPR